MAKHSKLGASQFARLLACPGSYYLAQQVPEPPESEYALEGTLAHEVCEHLLHKHYKGKGTVVSSEFSVEMYNYAVEYAFYCTSLLPDTNDTTVGIEQKLVLDKKLNMFGTADFACWHTVDPTAHMVDFKYGQGVDVDAVDNIQLLFYACALWKKLKKVGKKTKHIKQIKVHVYQPRVENVITTAEYSIEEIEDYTKQFVKAATDIVKIGEPQNEHFNVGNHCRFCPGLAVCNAQKEKNAQTTLQVLAEEPDAKPQDIAIRISDEQIAHIISNKKRIIKFIEEVEKYAHNQFESGFNVSGLKRVAGTQRRKWKSDTEEIGKNLIALGVEKPWDLKLKTITSIEKDIGKEALEPFVELTKQSKILVPESDKREALPEGKAVTDLLTDET